VPVQVVVPAEQPWQYVLLQPLAAAQAAQLA
jgi:hypothetical protein